MTTQNLALFKALGARMDYIHKRQNIISQNVSNADTPGYQPRDLKPVDFGRVLKDITEDRKTIRPETTSAGHMPAPGEAPRARAGEQKIVYEVAPAGNAVIMEEQLLKAGRNTMDYNLMANIYSKNVGMIRTALGLGGR